MASWCREDAAVAAHQHSHRTGIGAAGFDSCEQLLAQIEAAERAKPRPLRDDDIVEMRWPVTFSMWQDHNESIDRLHAEIRRLRAIAGEGKS